LLEQKNRKRTRFQVAVYTIFAVNILVIAPMIIQGCKRENPADTSTTATTPVDTGTPPPTAPPDTNIANTLPPTATNPVVVTPPPPVTPPALTGTEYVIVKGDTLDSIHKKFSVSVKAIEDANPGIVPTKLHVGQKLQIPAAAASAAGASATVSADGGEVYVVKAGDMLSRIATSHGTTVKAIQALNNITTTKIKVGEKLKMPAPKASATPPAAAPVTTAPSAPATAPSAPAPGTQ